ncbi:MAG: protease complex subunit PrcB family protein [Gemmatimonas sp.]
MPPGTSIPLTRLRAEPYAFSLNSGVDEPERLVVRDSAAWSRLWTRVHARQTPIPPLPRVDFTRDMVVFAALGTKPSGGFSVLLDSAFEASDGGIDVVVRSIKPGPKCGVTAALTEPVDIARLARRESPVNFVERSETTDCP